ncbi:hypothetical protein [Bacillus multifaciens]|uniref:hypothetical protein n=1 Tax=Bacillus multifaciens TaxID=3068506 RepID=UPI00274191D0|nr:hypothetical protein [Bacillus sp. WLY-B-L8]MDP7981529.1 hypothetical protein [Bacillus sp. WLY-B-L8]
MKIVEAKTFCCNKCGRIHERPEQPLEDVDFVENLFHKFRVHFGYTSPFDDDVVDFMLCELCLFEMFREFKHKPVIQSVEEDNNKDLVEWFDIFRTEERPYYKDFFINTYNELENLIKK